MLFRFVGLICQAIQEHKNKKMAQTRYSYQKTIACTTPRITIHPQVMEWLSAPHLLIAGATGSGKSVLINLFIHDLLSKAPGEASFILLDPKRVELVQFKDLPHTMLYASERAEMIHALHGAINIMEDRYKVMQKTGHRKYTGGHVYVIIDEYADLIVTDKKTVEPLVLRLAQLGRAANVHLIIATQRPTRDVVTGSIKVNVCNRFALHCPTAQDSRNIIGQNGAESLPPYGEALYYSPIGLEHYEIPFIQDNEMNRVIEHWTHYN